MMDATVYLLKCGCTLCPASLIVRPWLTTWSTKVARISSEITVLGLPRPRPPRPPLTLTPLALPLFPMLASIAPKQKSSPVALYAKALIANCKTVWRVFALVMSQCAYLNGSVFLVKTRYFLHENCAKSRELCVVFWKKCFRTAIWV